MLSVNSRRILIAATTAFVFSLSCPATEAKTKKKFRRKVSLFSGRPR